jgi:eukaryotic-like serine/threonine-protein kinase
LHYLELDAYNFQFSETRQKMALEELQDGRYRFTRSLGSGGMGEVYLMQDMRINRQVAIKVIRSESTPYPDSDAARDAARLFQREAKAIAALEHPNILPLYDFGEEIRNGMTFTYMVMPFCTEGTLASWMRQRDSSTLLSLQDIAHVVEEARKPSNTRTTITSYTWMSNLLTFFYAATKRIQTALLCC